MIQARADTNPNRHKYLPQCSAERPLLYQRMGPLHDTPGASSAHFKRSTVAATPVLPGITSRVTMADIGDELVADHDADDAG